MHIGNIKIQSNAVVGGSILVSVIVVSLLGLYLSPYDPVEADFLNRFSLPSSTHILGTDEYGRDVFTRIATGSFVSLRVSALAVFTAVLLGSSLGAITGFFGGWIDRVSMMLIDSIMAFPVLLLVLGIMSALGPNETGLILSLGIAYTPAVTRIVRGVVFSLREKEFVEASKLIGNSQFITIYRHILPNCITPIMVIGTTIFTSAMLAETALSFLGLGVPPPSPSWGGMLADSRNYLGFNIWMGIFPGLAITFTLLGVNLIGDALRDSLDPRMRNFK